MLNPYFIALASIPQKESRNAPCGRQWYRYYRREMWALGLLRLPPKITTKILLKTKLRWNVKKNHPKRLTIHRQNATGIRVVDAKNVCWVIVCMLWLLLLFVRSSRIWQTIWIGSQLGRVANACVVTNVVVLASALMRCHFDLAAQDQTRKTHHTSRRPTTQHAIEHILDHSYTLAWSFVCRRYLSSSSDHSKHIKFIQIVSYSTAVSVRITSFVGSRQIAGWPLFSSYAYRVVSIGCFVRRVLDVISTKSYIYIYWIRTVPPKR